MYLIIKDEIIDIKDYGLRCLKYTVPPPSINHVTESLDGFDGERYLESFYTERTIPVELALRGKSLKDMKKLKAKFNQLFARNEEFFVIFKEEPYRRYRVLLSNVPEWEAASIRLASTKVEFKMPGIYVESPGTTLNQPDNDYYYPIGEGKVDEGDPVIEYTFSQSSFSVFNDSDVPVDPRNMELVIEFKGASTNLSIKNLTTGDEWKHTGSTAASDVIRLEGVRSLKNGQSIFKNTNKKLITLAPGWNEFEITGATDFTISFDFRFYYI
ncbi:phage tail family protein [Pseudobacillus badius]|uniref:phage tail family protein n=1 Tax=Bacillus badius TaxID=1455 RepID=UPI0024A59806|nr:phage tail family protein [Bacillus badius]GLY09602.1 hypothetical protein Bbad01_08180 [Bacillus badius]